MTLLWAVPPVAVTVGMLMALAQLRQAASAAAALQAEIHRFHDVQVALEDVRSAAFAAGAAARTLHRD